jgi:hypothetical protein
VRWVVHTPIRVALAGNATLAPTATGTAMRRDGARGQANHVPCVAAMGHLGFIQTEREAKRDRERLSLAIEGDVL